MFIEVRRLHGLGWDTDKRKKICENLCNPPQRLADKSADIFNLKKKSVKIYVDPGPIKRYAD